MNLILLSYSQRRKHERKEGESDDGGEANKKGLGEDKDFFLLEASDKQSKHIIHHLKKTVGSRVRVGLVPNGPTGEAVISALPRNGDVHLSLDESSLRTPPNKPLVRILLGIPYPKVTAALWPVMTSLGVEHIIYAPATLTEPGFVETSKLQPSVYEPMLLEGLSQAEDTRPPRVTIRKDASVLDMLTDDLQLDAFTRGCCKVVLHIGDGYGSIRQVYIQSAIASASSASKGQGIFLAIGPERGWTDEEAKAFEKSGFTFASLGAPILRTDTAVVAALALARDVLLETIAETSEESDDNVKNVGKRKVEESDLSLPSKK